jgi:cytochrome c oxidase subunit IV
MAHATHVHEPHPVVGHLVPVSALIGTALALLVLTIVTVAVRYVDLGEANIFIALGIAVVKATLVCLFFMHLWWDRAFNSFIFVASVGFVALFMAFAMMDTSEYRADREQGPAEDVIKAIQDFGAADSDGG